MGKVLRTMVIDDGDMGGLLGCARAAEQVGSPAVIWGCPGDGADREVRIGAIHAHAEAYGIQVAGGLEPGTLRQAAPTAHLAAILNAALAATGEGCGRLVWCANHGGGGGSGEQDADLDAIALVCDRAVLVSRLFSLEGELAIETPFVDYSDMHMAELAGDMHAPIQTCWWARPEVEAACPEATEARARWTRAFERAGFGELLVERMT